MPHSNRRPPSRVRRLEQTANSEQWACIATYFEPMRTIYCVTSTRFEAIQEAERLKKEENPPSQIWLARRKF